MHIYSMRWISTAVALIVLNGCGSGSSETTTETTAPPTSTSQTATAFYVDAPLVNVDYQCGSINGKTLQDGSFEFEKGQGCRFALGNLMLREINASILQEGKVIVESDPNITALLQSLDTQPEKPEVIVFDNNITSQLQQIQLTTIPTTDQEREVLIEKLNQYNHTTYHSVTSKEAIAHVQETLNNYQNSPIHLTVPLEENTTTIQPTIPPKRGEENSSQQPNQEPPTIYIDSVTPNDGNTTKENNQTSIKEPRTPQEENNHTTINTNPNHDINDTTPQEETNTTHTTIVPEENNQSTLLPDENENNQTTIETSPSLIYTKLENNLYINDKKDVAIYIDDTLNKNAKLIYDANMTKKITQTLYRNFKDDYDFIFLITNNKEQPSSVSYSGVFMKVKNDVEGIGTVLYNHSDQYGSTGNLKGIMHFAYRGAVLRGPTLHEISHYWANKFRVGYTDTGAIDYTTYMIGKSGHWGYMGFFGGKGQLGGFDAQNGDFRIEKDANGNDITYESKRDGTWKIYSAKDFSWNANGAGRIPYNDLELYLMGFIPKEEVADMLVPLSYGSPLVPETKDFLIENNLTESGRNYFMAREVVQKSWAEIMSDHQIPERKPTYEEAQKSFKVLTVLLDTQMPKPHEINSISLQMEKFTHQADDGIPTNHNFWEATRGMGTLYSNNLDASLKTDGEEYPVEDEFTSEEISFHGKSYRTIRSPYTGRIWLDRNIGADRVCQSLTDRACYGGYFEFGRGFDGHQLPDSPAKKEKKQTITPNDNLFVLSDYNVGYDWVVAGVDDNGSKRIAFMNDLEGNGICPVGFRLPSMDELYAETLTNEPWDAFPAQNIEDDFLKLPYNGYRNAQHTKGLITEIDMRGAYWTNTTYLTDGKLRVRHMMFTKDDVLGYGTRYIGNGEGVRCIKAQ